MLQNHAKSGDYTVPFVTRAKRRHFNKGIRHPHEKSRKGGVPQPRWSLSNTSLCHAGTVLPRDRNAAASANHRPLS
ncbi:hypothetical protein CLOM_g6170 [Closterium sp. NIES-68]|nr:hypothetical protein CLOM_g6170 [Closterium sp. NIES-68]